MVIGVKERKCYVGKYWNLFNKRAALDNMFSMHDLRWLSKLLFENSYFEYNVSNGNVTPLDGGIS